MSKMLNDLNLSATYRVRKAVSGHDTRNGYEGAKWYELRMLVSSTAGTKPVYALQESFSKWQEIRGDVFYHMCKAILNSDSDSTDRLGGLAASRTEH